MGEAQARATYETARLRLARYRAQGHQAKQRAAAHAARVSAEALGVERAGVWMLQDQPQRLVCLSQFKRSTCSYESGRVLDAGALPAYLRALSERRIIAASDARNDPLTRELDAGYLAPMAVSSLLDAPIIREGKMVGVVRHEHQGAPRA